MILTALTPLEAWRMMPEAARTGPMLIGLEKLSYPLEVEIADGPLTAGVAA